MIIERSWDGMSARTLDAVQHYGYSAHPNRPYDPADFRRCYNWYVIHFGQDKERFKAFLIDVVEVVPIWKETAENWDELERLYLEETENETSFVKAPKLYSFMDKIHKSNHVRK
jgi:hypothetical protein